MRNDDEWPVGPALDVAVARALGHPQGGRYSSEWVVTGPLLHKFRISLSPPDSLVHRNGGPHAGWGSSGVWSATSWVLRREDGTRSVAFHETEPLIAVCRLIVDCNPSRWRDAVMPP